MKFAAKKDIFIIIGIVAACIIVYAIYNIRLANDDSVKAEIYYYSKLVKTVDLDKKEDRTFTMPQDKHVKLHVYKDGSIAFIESDCPDKVCINTGKINKAGQSAACLPNGIVVKIVSKDKNSDVPDVVVGNQ